MVDRSRSTRLRPVLVGVVVLVLAGACADPRAGRVEMLRAQHQGLALPGRFRFVDERVVGDLGDCVAAPCLRVTRYLITDEAPEVACAAIETSLKQWADDIGRDRQWDPLVSTCRFSGRIERSQISVVVVRDRPIESGDGHIFEAAIQEPHGAVVTVSLIAP